jgi:hypothetical protein
MHATRLLLLVAAGLSAGCSSFMKRDPNIVPAHKVVNRVKADLHDFGDHPWVKDTPAASTSACQKDGKHIVQVIPTDVKVILKTVNAREYQPSGGFESPLGILSFEPSYSGAYARSDTNSMEIQMSLPKDNANNPAKRFPDVNPEKRPLFSAISDMATELILVDHTVTPCLTLKGIKATVLFGVIGKDSTGFTVKVLGMKLGHKHVTTNEFQQTLEITFDLTGSSEAISAGVASPYP